MEKVEETGEKQAFPKAHVAIRCAKAAILLSSMKNFLNSTNDRQFQDEENEEVEMLKMELVKEKMKNKKVKLCSVMELFLQIMVLLSFWTLCLLLAFNFLG